MLIRSLANRQSLWLLFAGFPISALIAFGLFSLSSRNALQADRNANTAQVEQAAARIGTILALAETAAAHLRVIAIDHELGPDALAYVRKRIESTTPNVVASSVSPLRDVDDWLQNCPTGCWREGGKNAQHRRFTRLTYLLPAPAHGLLVRIDLDTESIRKLLRDISRYERVAFIVDTERKVILAHADPRYDGTPLSNVFRTTDANDRIRAGQLFIAQDTGTARAWSRLRKRMVYYHLMPIPRTRWSLAISVPESKTKQLSYHLAILHFGALTLGMLLLVLLMRAYLAYSLKPLDTIANAARRIADGEFNFDLPAPSRNDEIGRMSISFLRMRATLQENLRMLESSAASRERDQSAMDIARQIQRAMLPSSASVLQDIAGVDIAEFLLPQRDVGGDFYTFFPLGGRRLFFMIGDVADKGVAAALLMARTTSLAQALAPHTQRPDDLLAALNDELVRGNAACMFVTAVCAMLDTGNGRLMIASAGHDPAICLTPPSYPDWLLPDDNGPALGLFEDATYPCTQVQLLPGQMLLLYTDGITEAENIHGEQFGEISLVKSLTDAPISSADDVVFTTVESIRRHVGNAKQSDDLSLLCVRWMPPDQIQALDIINRMPDVFTALNWVEDSAQGLGMSIEDAALMRVVAEELLVNTVTYGYPDGRNGRIHITLIRQAPYLTMRFVDNADHFNPTARDAAQGQRSDAERSGGGEGLHLAEHLSASMRYYRKHPGNMLEVDFTLSQMEYPHA